MAEENVTNFCEKCDEHYKAHVAGLTFAIEAISISRNLKVLDVKKEYFRQYHARGHRRALRDD